MFVHKLRIYHTGSALGPTREPASTPFGRHARNINTRPTPILDPRRRWYIHVRRPYIRRRTFCQRNRSVRVGSMRIEISRELLRNNNIIIYGACVRRNRGRSG